MEHLRISLAFFFWSTEASWNLLIKKKIFELSRTHWHFKKTQKTTEWEKKEIKKEKKQTGGQKYT